MALSGRDLLNQTRKGIHEITVPDTRKRIEAGGAVLIDVREQDDLNRVWAEALRGHLPATTTVEVSRLATHARCKIEISAIAVADA